MKVPDIFRFSISAEEVVPSTYALPCLPLIKAEPHNNRQAIEMCCIVRQRWRQAQLSAAWAAWLDMCGQRKEKRLMLQSVVRRLQQGGLARAFAGWCAAWPWTDHIDVMKRYAMSDLSRPRLRIQSGPYDLSGALGHSRRGSGATRWRQRLRIGPT